MYLIALPPSRPINLAITFSREMHQVDRFYLSKSVEVRRAEEQSRIIEWRLLI